MSQMKLRKYTELNENENKAYQSVLNAAKVGRGSNL